MVNPLRRASRRLAGGIPAGIPVGFLVALAALVLVAILFTVATRKGAEPRGYAEMTLFRNGCLIDSTRQTGAIGCEIVGPRTYRIAFARTLKGSTPIASRGSCCVGGIGASVATEHAVILVVASRVKRPTRASVLLH
jgi:hypothetical protein